MENQYELVAIWESRGFDFNGDFVGGAVSVYKEGDEFILMRTGCNRNCEYCPVCGPGKYVCNAQTDGTIAYLATLIRCGQGPYGEMLKNARDVRGAIGNDFG